MQKSECRSQNGRGPGVSPVLYPFEGHFFDVGGARMHYLDEGAGEPVVLLHGNPTWSFYYRDLIKALRPTHRVIAPDHVGMGLSKELPIERWYRQVRLMRIYEGTDEMQRLIISRDLLRGYTKIGGHLA